MNKWFELHLNKFDPIPHDLRVEPTSEEPLERLSVPLRDVFHHLYWDSYRKRPLPTSFDFYRQIIRDCDYFCFDFADTEAQQGDHNKWGRGVCRWFLDSFQRIPFFANISRLEAGTTSLPDGFGEIEISRRSKGNLPDYFCARSVGAFFIAEAKGRSGPVSNFDAGYFDEFRDQLGRVRVTSDGAEQGLKGYIVATRMLHEQKVRARPCIAAEDPLVGPPDSEPSKQFGSWIVASHYARVLRKLRLSPYAAALEKAVVLPESFRLTTGLWECRWPSLKGKRFVGGFVAPEQEARIPYTKPMTLRSLRLDLSLAGASFVGLAQDKYNVLRSAVYRGIEHVSEIEATDWERDQLPEEITVSGDGTIIGPLEYFELVDRAD